MCIRDSFTADGKVKIGYVGAYNYAEVVSGYPAFFLGVQRVYPNVAMEECSVAGNNLSICLLYTSPHLSAGPEPEDLFQLCGGFAGVRLLWPAGGHGRWCGH